MTWKSKPVKKGSQKAIELLERIPNIRLPIAVRELAVSLGHTVRSALLDDQLSGMAFIANDEKVIVVNSKHHQNRQRFTIAHELGHHIMHYDMLSKGVHVDKGVLRRDVLSSTGTEICEIEANAFAAELLMPERLINHAVSTDFDLDDDMAIGRLAAQFGVSAAAMSNRITNLR